MMFLNGKRLISVLGVLVLYAALAGVTLAAARTTLPSAIPNDDPIGGGTTTIRITKPVVQPIPVRPAICAEEDYKCQLQTHAKTIEKFLASRKNGLPYTPDPRTLTPFSELIRLNVVPQVQGYLNLYSITKSAAYLTEARDRLDYLVGLGSEALGQRPWDGNLGYVLLDAYQRIGGDTYRQAGLAIADECLTFHGQDGWATDLILNWGYMCGMNLGKAYAITGNQTYLNQLRTITRRTADRQNTDGGFPHLPMGLTDTLYSTWMMSELLDIRQDDPQNPDVDANLMKAETVLMNRVNQDGSLNYSDSNGNYANNAGSYDTRGWTATLSGLAYYARAMGHDAEMKKLLSFLFTQEGTGVNSGGYADKYAYPESDAWSSGNPSIVRTSIIFADLTALWLDMTRSTACPTGTSTACIITASNCSPAFIEAGKCSQNLAGVDRCINGQATKCINPDLIKYKETDCGEAQCSQGPGDCWHICTAQGMQLCVAGACGQCIENTLNTKCVDICEPGKIPEACVDV